MRRDCVALGIDPGRVSGAAIIVSRGDEEELVDYQVVDDAPGERHAIALRALEWARRTSLPLVVALESHSPGGWSYRTSAGLAQRRGAWIETLQTAGIARRRIVSVLPVRWRKDVIGVGRAPGMTRVVRAYVHERFGWKSSNENVREAVCIALWAANSEQALGVLPKGSQ